MAPQGFAGFAWPWLLLALPLPWLARRVLPSAPTAVPALRVPWPVEQLQAIADGRGLRRAVGIGLIAWLGWAMLCVAAARPQQYGEVIQPPLSGRDLMLALDLSGSMGEGDMVLGGRPVDRLTAAKAVLADFLDRRRGDRVGMIVFGQRAYVLTPLTLDHDSVREQLLDAVVGLAGRETAIGDAIGLAVKRLASQPEGQRVLVLLTDGVNTAGQMTPERAAQLAGDYGVRVHTIAFGGESGGFTLFGIPIGGMGGAEDSFDEAGLQRIAVLTGGRAFRARDMAELAGIYAEIQRLEPVQQPGQAVRPVHERYIWPLGSGLALLLLAAVLAGRRMGT
ncbi:MAG: VWA domain-containing protein [Pseudoxanthomonas suwonensis]|nr:VWA domain-containing protein [Pseudoxanthomonas suwonensis]